MEESVMLAERMQRERDELEVSGGMAAVWVGDGVMVVVLVMLVWTGRMPALSGACWW
jgi:hypothetical protein